MRVVLLAGPEDRPPLHRLRVALTEAIGARSVEAVVRSSPHEHDITDGDVFVVCAPHEWVLGGGAPLADDPVVAARTIGLSVAPPTGSCLTADIEAARSFAALLGLSSRAADTIADAGLATGAIELGYIPSWDRSASRPAVWDRTGPLCHARSDLRHLTTLASAAPQLADRRATLALFGRPGFGAGNGAQRRFGGLATVREPDGIDRLVAAEVLVAVHGEEEPWFDMLRFVEATHCGTAVLSEAAAGTGPFRAGSHFVQFERGQLAEALDALPAAERLDELAANALRMLKSRPFSDGVVGLLDVAIAVVATTAAPTTLPAHVAAPAARARAESVAGSREADRATEIDSGQPGGEVAAAHDVHTQDVDTQDVETQDVENRDVENRDVENRDVEARDVEARDVEARDVESKAAERAASSGLGGGGRLGRRARLKRLATKVVGVGPRTVSPAAVAWRGAPPRIPRDHGFVTTIVDGLDEAGQPSLEGLFAWDPSRLAHGQHLGRVLLVDPVVADAAAAWVREPWAAEYPHVVVQLFCAVNGIPGHHVACPVASLEDIPIDPQQRLPDDVAQRCRELLAEFGALAGEA